MFFSLFFIILVIFTCPFKGITEPFAEACLLLMVYLSYYVYYMDVYWNSNLPYPKYQPIGTCLGWRQYFKNPSLPYYNEVMNTAAFDSSANVFTQTSLWTRIQTKHVSDRVKDQMSYWGNNRSEDLLIDRWMLLVISATVPGFHSKLEPLLT